MPKITKRRILSLLKDEEIYLLDNLEVIMNKLGLSEEFDKAWTYHKDELTDIINVECSIGYIRLYVVGRYEYKFIGLVENVK